MRYTLHHPYERLIGTVVTDPALLASLLADPEATALRCGLSRYDAALAADIRATCLGQFARALHPRLYETDPRRTMRAG